MEIVGAAQFVALPRLGLPEIVEVGNALHGYELRELAQQLPPLQESAPGQPEGLQLGQLIVGVGQQPQRALYFKKDERFVAQLQRDRIAINERRVPQEGGEDPSSTHVWPALQELSDCVQGTLAKDTTDYGPLRATFVELTYVNAIRPAAGVWENHHELDRVLRVISGRAGEAPWTKIERAAIRFSFPILDDDTFRGRLHVAAEPAYQEEGIPILNLNLITRRLVDDSSESLEAVFDACHCDAVSAFTAVTTERMHHHWGRIK